MKKKKKKKTWQKKATSVGVEGFVDWTNPGVSESVEEVEISGLVSSFASRMRKRATST